jgi:hypothetical protein
MRAVIKGWDKGVATMKKGEKSVLVCAPDYAYGAAGSPPTIPPNATLSFEARPATLSMDTCLGTQLCRHSPLFSHVLGMQAACQLCMQLEYEELQQDGCCVSMAWYIGRRAVWAGDQT